MIIINVQTILHWLPRKIHHSLAKRSITDSPKIQATKSADSDSYGRYSGTDKIADCYMYVYVFPGLAHPLPGLSTLHCS